MDEFEELGGEFPDIHALFMYYNDLYFNGVLLGNTTVEWSSGRMTLCGGICKYHPLSGCQIKLSEPLLKLRPVRDLKMVLLHEMIHAHNMILRIRDSDPGGHGPPFVELMNKINNSIVPDPQRPPGGYNITTTHSMHGEVNNYRTHWWECERCKKFIKRAMNRPPQEADCIGRTGHRSASCRDPNCGYHTHLRNCGGAFIKIREPEPKPKASRTKLPTKKHQQQQPHKPVLPPGQQRIDEVARGIKRRVDGPLLQAEEPGAAAAAVRTITGASEPGATGGTGSGSNRGGSGPRLEEAGDAALASGLGMGQVGPGLGPALESGLRFGRVAADLGGGFTSGGEMPLAELLRRRCAEAALARFQSNGPQQDQQQQDQQQSQLLGRGGAGQAIQGDVSSGSGTSDTGAAVASMAAAVSRANGGDTTAAAGPGPGSGSGPRFGSGPEPVLGVRLLAQTAVGSAAAGHRSSGGGCTSGTDGRGILDRERVGAGSRDGDQSGGAGARVIHTILDSDDEKDETEEGRMGTGKGVSTVTIATADRLGPSVPVSVQAGGTSELRAQGLLQRAGAPLEARKASMPVVVIDLVDDDLDVE